MATADTSALNAAPVKLPAVGDPPSASTWDAVRGPSPSAGGFTGAAFNALVSAVAIGQSPQSLRRLPASARAHRRAHQVWSRGVER